VATGLSQGDDHVHHAVPVSFVEDTGWWEPEMQAFIATWPAELVHQLAVLGHHFGDSRLIGDPPTA